MSDDVLHVQQINMRYNAVLVSKSMVDFTARWLNSPFNQPAPGPSPSSAFPCLPESLAGPLI